jgi:hypothetical protein
MKYSLTVILLATALPLAAADPTKEPPKPADFKGNAIMCDGTYALCIKAPCEKKVSGNNQVRCECVIENGWSMGPNSCTDRTSNLTSTYSNRFNVHSSVLSCPQPIEWAWCYGSSCEPDPKDPKGKTAICRCPVVTSQAVILVGDKKCPDASTICAGMWSAAYPQESQFANDYYHWWMTKNGHPAEKAAPACPAP